MNRLPLPDMINELCDKKIITQQEKTLLLQRTSYDEKQIFQILTKYATSQNPNEFAKNLHELADKAPSTVPQPGLQKASPIKTPMFYTPKVNDLDEATSPWGNFLHKKKMINEHNSDTHEIKAIVPKDTELESPGLPKPSTPTNHSNL